MPYVPGFLAFREAPACAVLLKSLPSEVQPQVVLVDGNGVFHPRRCGCATHLGVCLSQPTIGVAKKVMKVGDVNTNVARQVAMKLKSAGSWLPLVPKASTEPPLAVLLKPRDTGSATLVVSVGHLISLTTAANVVAAVCKRSYRMAEPVRMADMLSRLAVKQWLAGTPLPEMRIAEASARPQNGQESVLPVLSTCLAQQQVVENPCAAGGAANDTGSQPAKRRRGQRWVTKEDAALLRVPGAEVSLPDDGSTRATLLADAKSAAGRAPKSDKVAAAEVAAAKRAATSPPGSGRAVVQSVPKRRQAEASPDAVELPRGLTEHEFVQASDLERAKDERDMSGERRGFCGFCISFLALF